MAWMFHSKTLISRINKHHEKASGIVSQDHISLFTELLKKATSTSMDKRNMQLLADELFKGKMGCDHRLWTRSSWKIRNIIT